MIVKLEDDVQDQIDSLVAALNPYRVGTVEQDSETNLKKLAIKMKDTAGAIERNILHAAGFQS